MKIKIEGATPQNIAQTIQDILEQFELDMWDSNIYINFTKNGAPMVSVNDEYEEVNLLRKLDPNAKTPKMTLCHTQFITKSKLKAYQEEKEIERFKAYKHAEIQRNMGYLYLGRKDDNYKLFITKHNPSRDAFKNLIKQKEKNGYIITLIVRKPYIYQFLDHLKSKFKADNKEVSKGSYPFFNLNSNDMEYIKSKADDIIKEVSENEG